MQYLRSTILLVFVGLSLASSANGQGRNLLKNPGGEPPKAESIEGWFPAQVPAKGLRMWRDTEIRRSGESSFAIVNNHVYDKQVCNNWAQILVDCPVGKTLELRAFAKTDNAELVGVCVQCISDDPNQEFLAFASTPEIKGTRDWVELKSRPFVVPKGTTKICIRASLCGTGSVRFDDVGLYETNTSTGPGELADSHTAPDEVNDAMETASLQEMVKGRILETLPLIQDCLVISYLPDWNHGQVDNLAINNVEEGARTLLRWNKVPDSLIAQPNTRFMLAIFARKEPQAPNRLSNADVVVSEVVEEWPERTSWKQQPKYSKEVATKATFSSDSGWKLLDVTDLVRDQSNSKRSEFGVVVQVATETDKNAMFQLSFVSREAIGPLASYRPVLLAVEPSE